jgi:hypothetical protein
MPHNRLTRGHIDPYPDDAVPIGLFANLAISSSRDIGVAADKQHKGNATADDDDVVRYILLRVEVRPQGRGALMRPLCC